MKNSNLMVLNVLIVIFVLFSSCNKNGSEPKDCLGVEGGTAVVDACGVCEGDGSTCDDCINVDDEGGCCSGYTYNNPSQLCTPDQFLFNSSTQQAAWFFYEVALDGEMINSDDWVGAFNTTDQYGEVCVGARKWNTSACGGGVCDLPVLGEDGQLTSGYMSPGQIPTFKIFRASDLSYNPAEASEDKQWFNFGINEIDCLSESVGGCSDEEKK